MVYFVTFPSVQSENPVFSEMSASELALRRFIDTLEEGARLRRMDYGAVNTASLGKRRRPPGSGWDSAAPPTMPRTGGRPPPRDDDEDAFLDLSLIHI